MPEYLAPGVYVEEIDTGSKPIEGVSTSTAGMVGVTERGPVNVPILVTSFGQFALWFGGYLNIADFSNNNGQHCYLPHAVQGFFTNGGKRIFVVRTLNEIAATRATFDLHDRGSATSASTRLLLAANPAALSIYVLNVNAVAPNTGSLASADRIRIGGGSDAEYRTVAAAAPGPATHVPLSFPISRTHDPAVTVNNINRVASPNAFNLFEAATGSARSVVVTVATPGDIAVNDLLEIGSQFSAEHRFIVRVTTVDPTHLRLDLDSPLVAAHNAGDIVSKLNPQPGGADEINNNTLAVTAHPADSAAFLIPPRNDFVARDQLIIFDRANNATREARRIGNLSLLRLSIGSYGGYPSGTLIQGVDLADDGAVTPKSLSAAASAGATVIALDNRAGLSVGDVLGIGTGSEREYVTIVGLPNPSPGGAPPNQGNVLLAQPVNHTYAAGVEVRRQSTPTIRADRPATVTALDVENGGIFVPVTDGGPAAPPNRYLATDFVRVTTSVGDVSYHLLAADAAVCDARPVSLTVPFSRPHAAGSPVAERKPLLRVQALDAGGWGNRLRVAIEDEPVGLSHSRLQSLNNPNQIVLSSLTGIEPGTVLQLFAAAPNSAAIGDPLKVSFIDRANRVVNLDGIGLSAAQIAAHNATSDNTRLRILSLEFRLTAYLLRQPDPAVPSRGDTFLDTEMFRYLSMDARHSHYVETVIGTTWNLGATDDNGSPPHPLRLDDRRSEGESRYLRVYDFGKDAIGAGEPDTTLQSIRLGPEPLVDLLPDGRARAARHELADGNDAVGTISDDTYIGIDDSEPLKRTGLLSLRNEEEISIVACPGRTGAALQAALIEHCELMRYRFAVLDAQRPPKDSLNDVQTQRQQFDTKYAAIYHPWMLIPDPFPANLAAVMDYAIPPSGHVMGIYARTDNDRGVHKAPANEVVRGVTGLQRILNKGEQDILNPFPVNINVIRDFPDRGIRVWGGRVITSDPDWKYVNVRRLLIFIEASIDRGLQWVVFEPNGEQLWARVNRTVSNFLTSVWRDGALEGTKPEEAYFVKVDRTTMTQTDIDNGRLIVVIGVAPVKPAEFVIFRIGLMTSNGDT
jgi:hypothetical protein